MAVAERNLPSSYRWVVLTFAFMAQFSNALSVQALAPLAPLFQPELGLTKVEVGLFSSAVFAGSTAMLFLGGAMTDRIGVKRMMVAGQLAAGSFLLSTSLAEHLWQAVLLMLGAGAGGGMLLPAVTKSIMLWFSQRGRATAMGIKQAAVPAGGVFTAATLPTLGLLIGWRPAVASVGVVVLVLGVLTALFYRDSGRPEPSEGSVRPLTAGMGKLLRSRKLWMVSLVAVLFVTGQLALITYLALYMKEVVLVSVIPDENTRIVAAGGFLALCQMGGVFGRVFWGFVSDRFFGGRRMVVLALVGLIAASMSVALAFLAEGLPLGWLALLVVVYGASAIGWNGVYHVLVAETAGREFAGTGVGLSMTLNQFGTVGGPPLFGLVVDLSGSYHSAWLLMAGLTLAGTVLAVANIREEKRVGQS